MNLRARRAEFPSISRLSLPTKVIVFPGFSSHFRLAREHTCISRSNAVNLPKKTPKTKQNTKKKTQLQVWQVALYLRLDLDNFHKLLPPPPLRWRRSEPRAEPHSRSSSMLTGSVGPPKSAALSGGLQISASRRRRPSSPLLHGWEPQRADHWAVTYQCLTEHREWPPSF